MRVVQPVLQERSRAKAACCEADEEEPQVRVWTPAEASKAQGDRGRSKSTESETESLAEGQPDGRWDGTINGAPVPQGAYSWEAQARFLDGRVVRSVGTVTVLR